MILINLLEDLGKFAMKTTDIIVEAPGIFQKLRSKLGLNYDPNVPNAGKAIDIAKANYATNSNVTKDPDIAKIEQNYNAMIPKTSNFLYKEFTYEPQSRNVSDINTYYTNLSKFLTSNLKNIKPDNITFPSAINQKEIKDFINKFSSHYWETLKQTEIKKIQVKKGLVKPRINIGRAATGPATPTPTAAAPPIQAPTTDQQPTITDYNTVLSMVDQLNKRDKQKILSQLLSQLGTNVR